MLCKALQSNSTLKTLNLSCEEISNRVTTDDAKGTFLFTFMATVNSSGNDRAAVISEALKSNSSLTKLILTSEMNYRENLNVKR